MKAGRLQFRKKPLLIYNVFTSALDVGYSIVPVSSSVEWFHTFHCISTAASSMVNILWEVSRDALLNE